jgi:hypothetical protein
MGNDWANWKVRRNWSFYARCLVNYALQIRSSSRVIAIEGGITRREYPTQRRMG